MSSNMKTLLATAAEMRSVGHTWESIAKEVKRKTKTCQAWPKKHQKEWEPIYREVQQRRFETTANECHARLHLLARHDDPKIQCKAQEIFHKYGYAAYGRNGNMVLPPPPDKPKSANQIMLDDANGWMNDTRDRMDKQQALKGLPPLTDEEFIEAWDKELGMPWAEKEVPERGPNGHRSHKTDGSYRPQWDSAGWPGAVGGAIVGQDQTDSTKPQVAYTSIPPAQPDFARPSSRSRAADSPGACIASDRY